MKHKIFKSLAIVVLFFFSWTFAGVFQVVYAVDNLRQAPNNTDSSRTPKSEERFQKATEEIGEILENPAIDRETKASRVKAKRTEIEDLDIEIKKQFAETEKKLKDAGLPPEILQRHHKFVKHYEDNLNELKDNLEGFQKSRSEAWAEKAKAHLKKVKPPKKHTPLDPNKLPHRTQKLERKEPRLKKEDFEKDFIKPQKAKAQRKPILVASNGSLKGLLSENSEYRIQNSESFTPQSEIRIPQLMIAQATNLPTPEDLAENIEVQFTPEIIAKAQELGNNPVKIYNWVRNNIEFVPTYGSIQGAHMTLLTKQGNAFDTASLLIALLRVSNIPARYVYGTIELPIDKVMNWVGGFTDANAALDFIASGGIPVTGIISGGKVTKARLEHVWVEAWVDYIPSRGARHKIGQGDTWISLDTSFKQYIYKKGLDLQNIIGFEANSFIESLKEGASIDSSTGSITNVNSGLIQTKFDEIKNTIKTKIESLQDPTVGDIIGSKDILTEEQEALPASLQYKIVLAGWEGPQIADVLRHKIIITMNDPEWGDQMFSATYVNANLAGKRITVAYIPATMSDAEILKRLGYYNVNPYLVNLKPVIYIDGTPSVVGTSVGMGVMQALSVSFVDPQRSTDTVTHKFPAATYAAIGLDLQKYRTVNLEERKSKLNTALNLLGKQDVNADDVIGEILSLHNLGYFYQVDIVNRLIARGSLAYSKQPGEMLSTLTPAIEYLYGVPYRISGLSMEVDVKRYIVQVASLSGKGSDEKAFMMTSSAFSSAYEHLIFEQLHQNTEGVSAVKLLSVANQQGIPIYTINSSNSALLSRLNVSSGTTADIQNAIAAGKQVIIPERSIQYNSWSGDGYIIMDEKTGASAYMISGGLAGGSTTRDDPLLDAIKEILLKPLCDYVEGIIKFVTVSAAFATLIKTVGYLASGIFAVLTGLEMYEKTGSAWKAWLAGTIDFLLCLAAGVYVSAIIFAAFSPIAAIVAILLVSIIAYFISQLIMWIIENASLFRPRYSYFARNKVRKISYAV